MRLIMKIVHWTVSCPLNGCNEMKQKKVYNSKTGSQDAKILPLLVFCANKETSTSFKMNIYV